MSAAEDLDPDSIMGSSSSESPTEEDTDLFPDETTNMTQTNPTNIGRPLTPQNNHLNALAPGELSPPRSQSQSQAQLPIQPQSRSATDDLNYNSSMANGNGTAAYFTESSRPDATDGAGDGKPGSGWKSKRAQEEYHRAMEGVVDRDFSLREFGDILAQEKRADR